MVHWFAVHGRAARTLAVLGALTVAAGLAGALAFAAWPSPKLPSDAAAVAMFSLPGTTHTAVMDEDHRSFGDEPGNSATSYWLFGSTDYGSGYIDLSQQYQGDPRSDLTVLRNTVTALQRQGWTVDGWPKTTPNDDGCCPEAHLHHHGLVLDLTAEAGGGLDPDLFPGQPPSDFELSYDLGEATPATVVPWVLIGLVLGALIGWLIVAWLARAGGTLVWLLTAAALLAPATLLSLVAAIIAVTMPTSTPTVPVWGGYAEAGTRPLAWLGLLVLLIALATRTWSARRSGVRPRWVRP
ncbi:MAG TPA: hypothetical protein VGJ28_00955 [Micromonosporaceae bacterium]|jgi:hypothetical protein